MGLYRNYIGVLPAEYNGKENGNYYSIIGCILGLYRKGILWRLYWDNGKENGSYYLGFKDFLYWGLGLPKLGVPLKGLYREMPGPH